MTTSIFLSLLSIALVAAWTPGPNNALVAASGAKFGFRRTIPHITGIGIGFPLMIFCVALGLGAIFQQSALLREGLRLFGMAILLWLAWNIAKSGEIKLGRTGDNPFTFLQSAGFQWINPKAWVMAISATSQFVDPTAPLLTATIISSVFVFAGFSSASGWALFGMSMQRWLTSEARRNLFNYVMSGLLVLSVVMIAASDLSI